MELLVALEEADNNEIERQRPVYCERLNYELVSDKHLLRYYRFPRVEISSLIEELEPLLQRNSLRNKAIPVGTQILAALRFYASGSFQSVIGDSVGLSQSSVSRIISTVTASLVAIAQNEIKMPSTALEKNQAMQEFGLLAGFPQVIGAIDGTHIPIKAPVGEEAPYVNRKNFHSLNVQAVCDASHVFRSYCARYPGSTHDSFVWANSTLRERFQHGEFGDAVLVGDSGYPLEASLMTPYSAPASPAQQRYNTAHSKTRVVVEKSFGILKSRFRCLHRSGGSLQYSPQSCAQITIACMLLHNRCIRRKIPLTDEVLAHECIDVIAIQERQGRERELGLNRRQEILQGHFSY